MKTMANTFDETLSEFFDRFDLKFGHIKNGAYKFAGDYDSQAFYSRKLADCLDIPILAFALRDCLEFAEFPNQIKISGIRQAYKDNGGTLEPTKTEKKQIDVRREAIAQERIERNERIQRDRMAKIVNSLPPEKLNELAGEVVNRLRFINYHFFFASKLKEIEAGQKTPFLMSEIRWLYATEIQDAEYLKWFPKSLLDCLE